MREHPGAPVSMPLEWPELERAVYPEDFHLKNARERLRDRGDRLRYFFQHRQTLAPLLESTCSHRARPMA